ncbi:MAG: putative phage abortive infection protein [Candidatus Kapaibacterium sp.]
MLKNRHISEKVAVLFMIIGVLIILLSLGVSFVNNQQYFTVELSLGEFGEFIGGFVGSLWSLAGILLFYSALVYQREELTEQKDILVKQTDAMISQSKELERQNDTLQKQKQEETFFHLLRFHIDLVETLTFESNDIDIQSGKMQKQQVKGRNTFGEFYNVFKRFYSKYLEHLSDAGVDEDSLKGVIETSYTSFFAEFRYELGHYFRNIVNLLLFIDRANEKDKHFFLSILFSQISVYEMSLIFFHGLTSENKELKIFIEKYALMQDLYQDDLIKLNINLYNDSAYKNEKYDFTYDID